MRLSWKFKSKRLFAVLATGVIAGSVVACVTSLSSVPTLSRDVKVADMPVLYDDDASGISFNDKRTCTLVTSQHVVMAAHYIRPVKSSVVFHDRKGKRLERFIVGVRKVYGDCAVGLLDQPVPAGYRIYPLLVPYEGLEEKLIGEFVLVTDQNKRLFVHEVRRAKNGKISFIFDEKKQIGYGKKLVKGDSGNPSFIMVNGEPALIETHHTGGAGSGPFYGDAKLIKKLKEQIDSLGGVSSKSLRLVKF